MFLLLLEIFSSISVNQVHECFVIPSQSVSVAVFNEFKFRLNEKIVNSNEIYFYMRKYNTVIIRIPSNIRLIPNNTITIIYQFNGGMDKYSIIGKIVFRGIDEFIFLISKLTKLYLKVFFFN